MSIREIIRRVESGETARIEGDRDVHRFLAEIAVGQFNDMAWHIHVGVDGLIISVRKGVTL